MFEKVKMKKAIFNVNANKWNKFKKIAKINNSDTNKELRKFIDVYLSKNSKLVSQMEEEEKNNDL